MDAKVNGLQTQSNLPARAEDVAQLPSVEMKMYKMEITAEHIRNYFAPPDATVMDIGFFLVMAKSLGLNPWKRELHMIPFYSKDGGRKYAAVVGYEVYLNRAEASGKLAGWEYEYDNDDDPTKCTVTVYRKDWPDHPFKHTVYMKDVIKYKGDPANGIVTAMWQKQGRFQLLKCTVTQTFRFCLPESCGMLPYIDVEQMSIPQNSLDQPQRITASITGAEAVNPEADVDYLRGQYFKVANPRFVDEDARHQWQLDTFGIDKGSVTTWNTPDFLKAISILEELPSPDTGPTAKEMQAQLGKDAPESYVNGKGGAEPEEEDGSDTAGGTELEVDSEEPSKETKIAQIEVMVSETPLKDVDSVSFTTWAATKLDMDEPIKSLSALSDTDLDKLITQLNLRIDEDADKNAKEQGELL